MTEPKRNYGGKKSAYLLAAIDGWVRDVEDRATQLRVGMAFAATGESLPISDNEEAFMELFDHFAEIGDTVMRAQKQIIKAVENN